MGCGSAHRQVVSDVEQIVWRGKLQVILQSAQIEQDFGFLGQIDPYLKLKFGQQEFKSQTCENGGLTPNWNEKMQFVRSREQDIVEIQIYNDNLISGDTLMGQGAFALTSVKSGHPEAVSKSILLYSQGQYIDQASLCHPEVKSLNCNGKVQLQCFQASITRDIKWISNINLFLIIRLDGIVQYTSFSTFNGQYYRWKDFVVLDRNIEQDAFEVTVWNFNQNNENELIGGGYFSITSALVQNSKVRQTCDLVYQGSLAGSIKLQMEFFPEISQQLDDINKPPEAGMGQFTYSSGDYYKGIFQDHLRNGEGECLSGLKYQGEWLLDEASGKGVMSNEYYQYTGQVKNGLYEGYGEISWLNGLKIKGFFVGNNLQSTATLTLTNGVQKKAQFQNGYRVKWLEESSSNQVERQVENKKILDPNKASFIPAGKALAQGSQLINENGEWYLQMGFDGQLQVKSSKTHQKKISLPRKTQRSITAPFFMRLEPTGELVCLDSSGKSYWEQSVSGKPPFKIVLDEKGDLSIWDKDGKVWDAPLL